MHSAEMLHQEGAAAAAATEASCKVCTRCGKQILGSRSSGWDSVPENEYIQTTGIINLKKGGNMDLLQHNVKQIIKKNYDKRVQPIKNKMEIKKADRNRNNRLAYVKNANAKQDYDFKKAIGHPNPKKK